MCGAYSAARLKVPAGYVQWSDTVTGRYVFITELYYVIQPNSFSVKNIMVTEGGFSKQLYLNTRNCQCYSGSLPVVNGNFTVQEDILKYLARNICSTRPKLHNKDETFLNKQINVDDLLPRTYCRDLPAVPRL